MPSWNGEGHCSDSAFGEGAAAGCPTLPPATAPVRPRTPGEQLRKCGIAVILFFPLLVHVEIHPFLGLCLFPGLDARGHERGARAGAD